MKKSVLPQLISSLAHLCAKPHPYHSVNNPTRGKSCSLAMQQLFPRVVAIFLLVLVSAGAWAADYVFMYKNDNTYNFLYNNNNAIGNTTTFNKSTCVFTSGTGDEYMTFVNGGYYLRPRNGNTSYSLNLNNSTSNTNRRRWTNGNNGRIHYNNHYLNYDSGWKVTDTDSPGTGANYTVLFTYSEVEKSLDAPVITGNNVLSAGGTYDYSVTALYHPGYSKFDGYSGTNTVSYYHNGTSMSTTTPEPNNVTSGTWVLEGGGSNASVNSTNGKITVSSLPTNDTELTLKCTVTSNGLSKTAEKTITLYSANIALPTITRSGNSVTLATTSIGADIYYTTDGSTPTASSTKYTSPIDLTTITLPVTIKAIAVRNSNMSEVASATYSQLVAPKPVISISSGTVTITAEDGFSIYYTTDGNDPTTSSTQYEGKFNVTNETTVKAIAVKDGYDNSEVASSQYLTSGTTTDGKVILNDYEDHNWTYYKGVDTSVDGGNYNTNYLGKMYSPDPRNVKITYDGNGGSVSSSETETSFVYYETIEKEQPGETDDYAYTVIPNPFSKRPNGKGFGGWKIISGAGETDGSGNIAGHKNGDVLNLDEKIHFINLDNNYSANCTSATIELQATWVNATIRTITSNPGSNQTYTFTGGTYETNFIVLKNVNYTRTMTISSPCTIMMVEPDGSADYRNSYTFTGNITVNNTGGTKIEYAAWAPSGDINANGKSLTIGRGVTTTGQTGRTIQGVTNTSVTVDQVVRVESGTYGGATHYEYGENNTPPNKVKNQIFVWGCDYDRAKGINSNLTFNNNCQYTNRSAVTNDPEQWGTITYIKSGSFQPEGSEPTNQAWPGNGGYHLYYMGRSVSDPKTNLGRRYLEIQGGELCNIAGGSLSPDGKEDIVSFALRIKGGTILGMAYGCARTATGSGSRCFVLTGGTVRGWIAPGANGTTAENGGLNGYAYLYVGGNARVDSNGSTSLMNRSLGGNVFGAGSGYSKTSNSGFVQKGTNVVVADNSYVERGVYGGGSFGYCGSPSNNGYVPATANIYITGGHVAGKKGGVSESINYTNDIQGGVYGGACQNKGGNVNIYMTGGLVETGLYGGSNADGTISNNVNIKIVGGQVGVDADNTANIHGGGYGASTKVSGSVEVTLGQLGQKGATLYGNVYGGSALGQVNTNTNNHTWVTMNSGTIHGSIFGGGMGRLTSTGRNASFATGEGVVNGAIKVVVNGTDPTTYDASDKKVYAVNAVFGGCDLVAYDGTPIVEIHNCESSIGYVYGGGNASDVQHTDVTVWGGDINYVFGGGNGENTSKPGADIVGNAASGNKGNTNVKIYGGTINYIFGGSNTLGNVTGTASVLLDEKAETGKSQCPILVQEAYGGANKAPMNGKPMLSIGCLSGRLENVYGGSKAVDVNSDIVLHITSGQFGKVFGGNNESGSVNGSITVNIDETGCHPIIIDELYAGGNLAPYTTPTGKSQPTVNVISCSHIGQVFGGGYGATAIVTGNPIVNINQIAGKYDPDDTDETDGWTDNPGTKLGAIDEVFGGGNAAKVVGDTYVNIGTLTTNKHLTTGATDTKCGANITGNVYGGGNQADVTGKTHVQVGPGSEPAEPTTTE